MTDQPARAQGTEPRAERTWPYALALCVIVAAVTLVAATSTLGERVVRILLGSLDLLYGIGAVISLLGILFAWLAGDRPKK